MSRPTRSNTKTLKDRIFSIDSSCVGLFDTIKAFVQENGGKIDPLSKNIIVSDIIGRRATRTIVYYTFDGLCDMVGQVTPVSQSKKPTKSTRPSKKRPLLVGNTDDKNESSQSSLDTSCEPVSKKPHVDSQESNFGSESSMVSNSQSDIEPSSLEPSLGSFPVGTMETDMEAEIEAIPVNTSSIVTQAFLPEASIETVVQQTNVSDQGDALLSNSSLAGSVPIVPTGTAIVSSNPPISESPPWAHALESPYTPLTNQQPVITSSVNLDVPSTDHKAPEPLINHDPIHPDIIDNYDEEVESKYNQDDQKREAQEAINLVLSEQIHGILAQYFGLITSFDYPIGDQDNFWGPAALFVIGLDRSVVLHLFESGLTKGDLHRGSKLGHHVIRDTAIMLYRRSNIELPNLYGNSFSISDFSIFRSFRPLAYVFEKGVTYSHYESIDMIANSSAFKSPRRHKAKYPRNFKFPTKMSDETDTEDN